MSNNSCHLSSDDGNAFEKGLQMAFAILCALPTVIYMIMWVLIPPIVSAVPVALLTAPFVWLAWGKDWGKDGLVLGILAPFVFLIFHLAIVAHLLGERLPVDWTSWKYLDKMTSIDVACGVVIVLVVAVAATGSMAYDFYSRLRSQNVAVRDGFRPSCDRNALLKGGSKSKGNI
ncbi:hypothetical protein LTR85_002288 [Meristemomyces frigidus]|nr:hypothetical protein LTR85_002288 [Meristemomyces frigidus]